MSDAILYNTLAWVFNGSDVYMNNAVHYIDTWFINPDTYMYPNLDFAQGIRGVGGTNGSHTGVLWVPRKSNVLRDELTRV